MFDKVVEVFSAGSTQNWPLVLEANDLVLLLGLLSVPHAVERASKFLAFSYAKIEQRNVFSWQQSVTVTAKTVFTPGVHFYRFLFLVLLLTLLFFH